MPLETPRTYVNLVFEPDAPRRRRRMPGKRLIGGVAALAVLGAAGGFLLGLMTADRQPARTILPPEDKVAAQSKGLDIVVDRSPPPVEPLSPPTPTPAPAAPIKADTPQPTQPESPPTPAPKAAPAPRVSLPERTAAPPPMSRPEPAAQVAEGAAPSPYSAITREDAWRAGRTTRPSFNCRYARTLSERMVCVDPRLAAADRRLARAYHRAISSGIPEPELRREQDIWLGARESAARHGPREVARTYEARIVELQMMARR